MLHSTFIKACNFADETVIINNLSGIRWVIDIELYLSTSVAGIVFVY